jgi:uncharacterized CHY-type Zn-finger protein
MRKIHMAGFQSKLVLCGTGGWNITTERFQAVTCQRCMKTHNYKMALVRHERES